MKKRKLITIASIAVLGLALAGGIAYGAYKFTKNTTATTDVGQIAINSTGFIDYRVDEPTGGTAEELARKKARASKLRKDTVVYADDIQFSTTKTYKAATGTVEAGVTYYSDQAGTVATGLTVGAPTTGLYVINTTVINGISGFNSLYGQDLADITPTITATTITIGDIVLDYELDIENARIRTLTNHDSTDTTKVVTLHTDKLGFVITDSTYAEKNKASLMSSIITSGGTAIDKVTCSATESKYVTANSSEDRMYLNQLAFAFTFTPEIDCYVRVHFEDAWLRHRKYASTVRESYIVKGEIEGESPFKVSGDWIYNQAENTAYFKTIFKPQLDETDTTGKSYLSQTYIFSVNPAYFYNGTLNSAYKDYIDVEVSFTVDAIQANRAKQVWGKDPFNNFADVE